MADKSDFVDMISEATRQVRRRTCGAPSSPWPRKPRVSAIGRRSVGAWRTEKLTPWKMRRWKFKDWDRG